MRYTGPQGKKARRLGQAFTNKQATVLRRRNQPPGQHTDPRGRLSEFGLQLKEKQKAKFAYGVQERQFYSYFLKAQNRPGVTGVNLLQILEQRLDNVVYRLGFAETRAQARQLVSHGFFQVNGKRVTIPSYSVKVGEVVSVGAGKAQSKYMQVAKDKLKAAQIPDWLDLNASEMKAKILSQPTAEDMDKAINTQLIIEHYSRI
ncbi:MAG: 30S ribosomal protein S4 [Candidatus Doudnabacteria bacterium]|nr:30S ribosomal protein S4 [Candidatus Doudnabacteria bacterium]